MTRRPYVDWLRGVAVLCMITWHVVDAWAVSAPRNSGTFAVVLFIAGWAAPLFLFLAGISIALAGAARVAAGQDRRRAAWALQKRGWQIFLLAHLFRFQSFVLNPNATWNSLFTPDILNVLGLGVVAAARCWGRARSTSQLAWWLIVPGLTAVLLAPSADHWWWPTLLPVRFEAYIRPVANNGVFSLFPTVGYVFMGAYVGARLAMRSAREDRAHAILAAAGAAVLAAAVVALQVPSPWRASWAQSLSLFLLRTGTMSLALAASYLWLRHRPRERFRPLVVLGQTSLLVYWVHVELAYGIFGFPWRHALPLNRAILASVVVTVLMVGLAVLWQRRRRVRWADLWRVPPNPNPPFGRSSLRAP